MKKVLLLAVLFLMAAAVLAADLAPLKLSARSRVQPPAGTGPWVEKITPVEWNPTRTAVIICDMWDQHWCPTATARVAEMAPAIDRFIRSARGQGMLIVHAPSETMIFYAGSPQRERARTAPRAPDLPKDMAKGVSRLPGEPRMPIDDTDGGCEVPVPRCQKGKRVWSRQIASIEIFPEDAISDSGAEMWNLFAARGIENVLIVGVHTNMCVVNRSFGLRNWARHGKKVMLVRDLTDGMYNPARAPHVDHFAGVALVVEHIERYICPSIESSQITGEAPFRFQGQR